MNIHGLFVVAMTASMAVSPVMVAATPQLVDPIVAKAPLAELQAPLPPTPVPPQPPTGAQTRPVAPAPAPPPPPTAPAPPERRQPVNIQVDVTIQSQGGSGAPISKAITMLVADGRQSVLTATSGPKREAVPFPFAGDPLSRRLNGDIRATLRDGKIELVLNLDFDVSEIRDGEPPGSGSTAYRGNAMVILDSGKPMIISKSADPISNRTVTVEVKATILK